MLYHPTQVMHYDPAQLGITPEEVWIDTEDGEKLHAWYFQSRAKGPAKARIIFFHGNAQNLTSHYLALAWILEHGYEFLIFDYRGYGRSPGEPSPERTVEDGKAALRWAHSKTPALPLVVFGQSLGGAVALRSVFESKEKIPIRLVVVESTFHSYQAAGRSVLSRNWLTWAFQPLSWFVLSDRYAPGEKAIGGLSPIPLVVIHGTMDHVIDVSLGKKVYALAGEPKEFWEVPEARHIESFWVKEPDSRARLLERLRQIK